MIPAIPITIPIKTMLTFEQAKTTVLAGGNKYRAAYSYISKCWYVIESHHPDYSWGTTRHDFLEYDKEYLESRFVNPLKIEWATRTIHGERIFDYPQSREDVLDLNREILKSLAKGGLDD